MTITKNKRSNEVVKRERSLLVYYSNQDIEWGKYSEAAKILKTSRGRAKYWLTKWQDENFHPEHVGGNRNQETFKSFEHPILIEAITEFFKSHPGSDLPFLYYHISE